MNNPAVRRLAMLTLGAIAASVALSLTSCNTIEGAGRDLQAIGSGTSNAARSTNDVLSGKKP